METFVEIFDKVMADLKHHYKNEHEKAADFNLHNAGFANWITENYGADLDTQVYPSYWTEQNFRQYIKEYTFGKWYYFRKFRLRFRALIIAAQSTLQKIINNPTWSIVIGGVILTLILLWIGHKFNLDL